MVAAYTHRDKSLPAHDMQLLQVTEGREVSEGRQSFGHNLLRNPIVQVFLDLNGVTMQLKTKVDTLADPASVLHYPYLQLQSQWQWLY